MVRVKGVKPYKCRYCAHTSALRGNCNQHIRKYHVGQPIDVIDLLAKQRRGVKDYDYAGLEGEGIAETKDIRCVRRSMDV